MWGVSLDHACAVPLRILAAAGQHTPPMSEVDDVQLISISKRGRIAGPGGQRRNPRLRRKIFAQTGPAGVLVCVTQKRSLTLTF